MSGAFAMFRPEKEPMMRVLEPRGTTAIIAATLLVGTSWAAARGEEAQKKTQLEIRMASDLVEMYADEHFAYPGPTDGLVPLKAIRSWLEVTGRGPRPEKDAWGNPLLYWSDGNAYMIVSLGADGEPEFPYSELEVPYEAVERGVLTQDPDRDVVIVCGEVWQGPVLPRARSRVTATRMRLIGNSVEAFAIDNNYYPGPTDGVMPLSAIEGQLSPVFIRNVPLSDGWDRPFLYWSDRTAYMVISTGADGIADYPYEEWENTDFYSFFGGETAEPRSDILWSVARFVQWPGGLGAGDCHGPLELP